MIATATRLAAALADRYRIERELGSGGMATVYLAHDLRHDRQVAVKLLHPELAAVLGADRFLNEIAITARLDHPHILTLIDSGASNDLLYYVLPFVRGESLRGRLNREKQLGMEDAIRITRDIGSALDYAHRQGVVHRDVKPENILIHEGEAVLADFGIALAVKEAGGQRLTRSGISLGTPQYMSPEQAAGDSAIDARSDQYSLAAMVYEMLVGEPPHTGPNLQAIIAKVLTQQPVSLRTLRPTVPPSIEAALEKALAKPPADRFPTIGGFVQAITAAPSPQSRATHRRWWMPVAGAGLLATVALVAIATRSRSGSGAVAQPGTSLPVGTRRGDSLPMVVPHPASVQAERSTAPAERDSSRDALTDAATMRTRALTARRGAIAAGATPGDLAAGDADLDSAEAMLRASHVTEALQQLSAATAAWGRAERSRRNTRGEIETLIRDYSRAVEWQDSIRMKAAFPELSLSQQGAWGGFFQSVRALRVELAITGLEVMQDSAYVDLKGTYEYVSRKDGHSSVQPVSFRATLMRVAGAWRMTAVR